MVDLPNGTASGNGADTISNLENIEGSQNNDTLTSVKGSGFDYYEEAANRIYGLRGDDILDGGPSLNYSHIQGGNGNDRIYGTNTNSAIYRDILTGGPGDDYIDGRIGMSLTSDSEPDQLSGDDGNDTLIGGDGMHNMVGGSGSDSLSGGGSYDFLDTIDGVSGNDSADGGTGGEAEYSGDRCLVDEGDTVVNSRDSIREYPAFWSRGCPWVAALVVSQGLLLRAGP